MQGNKTRNFGDRGGAENRRKKGGPVGKLDGTSSLRLDKDPRWVREVRDMWLYVCWSSALRHDIWAPRVCAVLDRWRQGIAWQRSPSRYLLPCICALHEKEKFQLFHFVQPLKMVHIRNFLALGCHDHSKRKSFSWPAMPVSNKKQEFELRKRIKMFGYFWVRAYPIQFCPEAPASSTVEKTVDFFAFNFWHFGNGLAIAFSFLLRFCYSLIIFFVYARARICCYRFF